MTCGERARRALGLVVLVHGLELLRTYATLGGALVCMGALVVLAWPDRRSAWGALGLLHFALVAVEPLRAANHHWLLGYVSVAVAIVEVPPTRPSVTLPRAATGLVGLVMGLATLHKLLSPDFVRGRFYAFLLSTHEIADLAATRIPILSRALRDNHRDWERLHGAGDPTAALTVKWPLGHLEVWAHGLGIATLVLEAALALAAVYVLRTGRGARAFAVSLSAFAASVVVLRPEYVFAALLTALAAAILPAEAERPRRWMEGQVALLCLLSLTR